MFVATIINNKNSHWYVKNFQNSGFVDKSQLASYCEDSLSKPLFCYSVK